MTEKVVASSGSEHLAHLYLFFGEEFLVKEEVRKLVAKVLPDELRGTNLIVLDGSNPDMGLLSSMVFTPSLFGGNRVIIVEQTSVFADRTDHKKMAAKVMESWRSGKRSASLTALARLLTAAGVDQEAIQEGTEWIADVLGEAASAEDREVMAAAGQAFLEEGKTIRGAADEQALDELLRSSFPEGTVLVFTAEAVDSRKKLFKTINEKGTVVACEVREQKYGAGLERSFFDEQVRAALNQKGKRIRPDALTVMYARSGKELRRLHAELEKLVAFLGEREEVTAQDVENLFADFHEAGVFDLANALRTADLKKCLPALHENLKTVENPLLTLGVIAAEVRRLMLARELLFTVFRSVWKPRMSYDQFVPVADKVRQEHQELMQKSKFRLLTLSDYSLYLLLKEAQRFTMERLFRIMEAVLEADTLMKSTTVGNRSPQSILENLIFTICAADDSKQQ